MRNRDGKQSVVARKALFYRRRDEGITVISSLAENRDSLANFSNGMCQANGIEIHFWRSGGNKPSLVASHGIIGSGACLSPLACMLDGDFDVILQDARGHGISGAPQSGYSYPDLAADVIALIDKLELKSSVLLGHSMGGLTAAVATSQIGSAVSGLVLIDPTFISPAWQREVFASKVAAKHRQMQASTRSQLLAQAQTTTPRRSAEITEYLVDARLRTSFDAFEVLRLLNPDFRKLVQLIRIPTLLVTAERGVVSVETARELQRLNPMIRLEQVSDVGHSLPYDEPERLGSIVMSFLRTLTRSGETGRA